MSIKPIRTIHIAFSNPTSAHKAALLMQLQTHPENSRHQIICRGSSESMMLVELIRKTHTHKNRSVYDSVSTIAVIHLGEFPTADIFISCTNALEKSVTH